MNRLPETRRRSRSGSPRSSGPEGRRIAHETWDLWNLKALWPDAELEDLRQLRARQATGLAREREALAGLWSGDRVILAPGHGWLAENPQARSGLTVSLHLGPYQLLPEPFLQAGLDPVVLLNENARRSFQPRTEALVKKLGYRTSVQWVAVQDPAFVRTLLQVLRDGRPVLIYLDGNTGDHGLAGTRRKGLTYALPGREIRLRTGLARLACRLGCPVHQVAITWGRDGQPTWTAEPTRTWSRADDPFDVTRQLFDWCFSRILVQPHQWHYWDMLVQSSTCFSPATLQHQAVPPGLREDYVQAFMSCLTRSPRTIKLILESALEVWPGDVLADLTHDRFFPAQGLRDADLDLLRGGHPSLDSLTEMHGLDWVRFHGLRLCLLGAARLGG